ncbi:TRAP transporter large permease subunit [Gudongella sp. DL1XJH-153]|uniref:TRAP transporter large permease subunit n=1 Tax=Gudongella sp. DL1XJH-153 TaxID=3409804 RepID=UPI003BB6F83D
MELGTYALIGERSLWALLPLATYLVLIFMGKKALSATLGGVAVGIVLTMLGPGSIARMFASSMGSFLALIGLIIMLGSGLGELMLKTGVSKTIVKWIIDKIGVNTEKKGILAIIVSSTVICGLLGTLAGGNAIIAPIIIPVVAAVGLTPSTVGAVFQSSGETGLIWGPFTGPVVALLAVTGLSYGRMMLWAALPFGIIWLVVIYFAAQRIQKNTKGKEKYDEADTNVDEVEITKEEILTTKVFNISFALLIGYGIYTGQGTSYAIFVMLALSIIISLVSRVGIEKGLGHLTTGMGKMASMFLLFVFLQVMLDLINLGGGFEALGDILMVMVDNLGREALMIAASFVGGFGVDGAAVAQLQITHDIFAPAVEAYSLPMEMWAIALIAASRITTSVYPTANMVGQMGIAKSNNIKAMLFGGWAVSLAALVYIIAWSFIGIRIFF